MSLIVSRQSHKVDEILLQKYEDTHNLLMSRMIACHRLMRVLAQAWSTLSPALNEILCKQKSIRKRSKGKCYSLIRACIHMFLSVLSYVFLCLSVFLYMQGPP